MPRSPKESPGHGPRLHAVCSSMKSCGTQRRNIRLPIAPNPRQNSDIVTIIYTSGTSGEPKGVCLSVGNLTHMLSCTTERLDQLMGTTHEPDRVFHYLPFNFAASTILLLSCLARESVLTLSKDLNRLADEIHLVSPKLFPECSHAAGTRPARRRRGNFKAACGHPFTVCESTYRLAAAARGARPRTRRAVALARPRAHLSQDSRALRYTSARADLRFRATRPRRRSSFFLMLGIPVLQA